MEPDRPSCASCRTTLPETPTRLLCQRCETLTDRRLAEIVDLQAITENELEPARSGSGTSTERTLGVRIDALDFLAGNVVLDVLESWERYLRETYGLGPYGPASLERNAGKPQARTTLVETVRFLRTWLPRAAVDFDAIGDLTLEIKDAHRTAERVARQTRAATWRVDCPTLTDDGDCGTSLVVPPDLDDTVYCRTCETNWSVDRLLTIAATNLDGALWLDPEACALRLGVTEVTLRRWAREGRINRQRGRYDLNSVRAAIEAERVG